MKSALTRLALLSLAFALTSCATVFNRAHKDVEVTSTPSNVKYDVTNRKGRVVHSGVTPDKVRLSTRHHYMRGQTYTFTARDKNGKAIGSSVIEASISPWYWGNFILGGLAGHLVIDPISGSMWTMNKHTHIVSGTTITPGIIHQGHVPATQASLPPKP